jgi:predicted ATPase/DNA-binding SARP family transcriptional activator
LELRSGDGDTVEIGGARLRMLLARLALDAGRVVPTATLVDGLWGRRPPADASNALQSLVSRLRKVVPDGLLESHPVGYRLAVRPEHVDVVRFERLAAQGHAELRAGQHRQAAATLAEALRLWRGAALADVAEAPFAQPAAVRLTDARVTALADRIEADLALGRHVELAAELEELVTEHPLYERFAGLWIRALYGSGRQADALAAYEHVRRCLADQLGVDPTPQLQAVHLAVLRRDPELLPRRDPPTPLPRSTARARLTSFVGRDADVAKILALLATSRLVCLVGAGGAGKTRLATEVASALAERDSTGVWFTELAPVGAGADLAQAVLTTLGVREVQILDRGQPHQPRTATERLVEVFSAQHGVLVLDNCEHLIGAAATLADTLLSQCPQLRILATSREPLAITGEALHWVGPLELPDESASPEEARDAAAVRLFVDRASAARPGFALDTDTVAAVSQICRRLDGMPLALELAAARLRAMTVDQVATRLDDRFRLLTGGNRTALPRHRTLRAVVDWSWELLTQDEHKLARRLAVLVGGATAEAATQVCVGGDLAAEDVPYLLASLAEKSLLDMAEGTDRQPRYRMLETVRAYGMERLTDAGEVETTQAAFVRYCTDYVEWAEPVMRTSGQLGAIAMLRAEHDNIIASLRQAVDSGDGEAAVRIAVAMSWYWMFSSLESEARAWVRTVLGAAA